MANTRVEVVNLGGRAQLVVEGRCIDVANRSGGKLPAHVRSLLADWDGLKQWAKDQTPGPDDPGLDLAALGPCVPDPRQIFAIGLNYKDHAAEAKLELPKAPMVFTKFPSCLAGPVGQIALTGETVDWEVELVVVMGQGGRHIPEDRALSRVAGYCVGQDISDRRRQFGDRPPQFSLGKSAPGFGPIGPAVVDLECLDDPNDLAISCQIDGVSQQDSRTSEMIFSVPQLVAYLSTWCELLPGDLIFTGTPAGVGSTQDPRRYLKAGERIECQIEGLGAMEHRVVAGN